MFVSMCLFLKLCNHLRVEKEGGREGWSCISTGNSFNHILACIKIHRRSPIRIQNNQLEENMLLFFPEKCWLCLIAYTTKNLFQSSFFFWVDPFWTTKTWKRHFQLEMQPRKGLKVKQNRKPLVFTLDFFALIALQSTRERSRNSGSGAEVFICMSQEQRGRERW